MNKVFTSRTSTTPLTSDELARAANEITKRKPFTRFDFEGENSRLAGTGHCECAGDGEFVLLPANDPDVIEGGKRYMQCRKCGCWSHL